MKDQKRKRTSILVIAGVLLMLAVIVGFFWHASRIKALPPKIFAQISECQALADLETAQEAPQDQNLAGLTPAEAYTAVCAGEDGESCTVYAYVFQNEADAAAYFKRVSGRDVSETGVSFFGTFSFWLPPKSMYCSIDHVRVVYLSGGAFSKFYPIADRILARLSINLIVGKNQAKEH